MAAGVGDQDVDLAELAMDFTSAARTAAPSAASACTTKQPVSSASAESGSRRRPITATLAPSDASRRATAAPIPVPPPVTKAVRPLNLIYIRPTTLIAYQIG